MKLLDPLRTAMVLYNNPNQ